MYNKIKQCPDDLPNEVIVSPIGRRLKAIRENAELSRGELARQLGYSTRQLQKYETGVEPIAVLTLLRIAEILKVSVWSFIEDEQGNLIDSQEQRDLYHWRSTNYPKLIDFMRSMNDEEPPLTMRKQA